MEMQPYLDTLESQKDYIDLLETRCDRLELGNKIRLSEGRKKAKRKSKHFTICYITNLLDITPSLCTNERALLFTLIPYVGYETDFLVDKEGQKISTTKMAKLMNWKIRHTIDVINALEKKGLLSRDKSDRNTHIKINTDFFYRGKKQ